MPHRQSRRLGGADAALTRVAAKRRVRRRDGLVDQDDSVVSFLTQLLVGDSDWSLSEVRRLVDLRDQARLGRS